MTRKEPDLDDLEQRLDDLERELDPAARRPIVFVGEDGTWFVDGREVDPDRVTPSLLVHLTAKERTIIDKETLEIVGREPIDGDDTDDTDSD